jgi:antitoxin ParD1/3/4
MNVSLTPQLESFVRSKVESGRYGSSSEVVREGLRLLEERDALLRDKLTTLRADIQAGLDDVDRGDVKPVDFDEIKRRGRQRAQGTNS